MLEKDDNLRKKNILEFNQLVPLFLDNQNHFFQVAKMHKSLPKTNIDCGVVKI